MDFPKLVHVKSLKNRGRVLLLMFDPFLAGFYSGPFKTADKRRNKDISFLFIMNLRAPFSRL